jgi:hypothetical protein
MDISTRTQCYKTFYFRNFRSFAISKGVWKARLENLAIDEHSSLLRTPVNYGQKSFMNVTGIKHFTVVIYEFSS